jgi:hypothetical protein
MISSETHFQVLCAVTIKQFFFFFFFFFFYRSFVVQNYEHAAGEYPVTKLRRRLVRVSHRDGSLDIQFIDLKF